MLQPARMEQPSASVSVRAMRCGAGLLALLTAAVAFTFSDSDDPGDAWMLGLALLNAAMFFSMRWFFHQRYAWWGADLDLYALIGLQALMIGLITFNLVDATMRGPAAPLYWIWMYAYALFTIDLGLGVLSTFPEALGLLRWYAYLLLASGAGIASMALLPWAGQVAILADVVMAVILFHSARTPGRRVTRSAAASAPPTPCTR